MDTTSQGVKISVMTTFTGRLSSSRFTSMVTSRVAWALEGKMRRASDGGDVGGGGTGGKVGGGGTTSQAVRNVITTAKANRTFLIAHPSYKTLPLPAVGPRETLEGAVVSAFHLWREDTTRQFIVLQMVSDALTAETLARAWFIGASALVHVDLLVTFFRHCTSHITMNFDRSQTGPDS
jgi:hypothetical protein